MASFSEPTLFERALLVTAVTRLQIAVIAFLFVAQDETVAAPRALAALEARQRIAIVGPVVALLDVPPQDAVAAPPGLATPSPHSLREPGSNRVAPLVVMRRTPRARN